MIDKDLIITQQDLVDWIDRPPSNDDLDLCSYLSNAVKNQYEYKRQIEIMEKYFELIIDLGYDYDGFNKEEDLKGLIDELVRYASLGRVCNTTEAIYVNQDKKYNILNEELKGDNK